MTNPCLNLHRSSSLPLLLSVLFFILLLTSCTSLKRYRSASYGGDGPRLAELSLYSASFEADKPGNDRDDLWDLSANAQTRLLQILDERYPSNEDFLKVLNSGYGAAEFPVYDRSRMDLALVFSVQRLQDYSLLDENSAYFSPADRLERFGLHLELAGGSGMEFVSWDRFETNYAVLDLADVSFSRSFDLDLVPGVMETDADLGIRVARDEKQEINRRYIELNGRLSADELFLEQEGNREVDPGGNMLVRVRVRFEAFPDLLFRAAYVSGPNQRTQLLGLAMQPVLLPALEEMPDTLLATLSLDYVYRHVRAGEKTFQEHDDKVLWFQGKDEKQVPLLVKRDLDPGFFGLSYGEGKMLHVEINAEEAYLLQFASYHEALGFLAWLRQTDTLSLPGLPEAAFLSLDGEELVPGKAGKLKVRSIYGAE